MRAALGLVPLTLLALVPARLGAPLDQPRRALEFGGLALLQHPPSPPAELPKVERSAACEDTNEECALWAGEGECDANPRYMNADCPASCNQCGALRSLVGRILGTASSRAKLVPSTGMDRSCSDLPDEDCAAHAKAGACDTNKTAMLMRCPRACGVCRFWDTLRDAFACEDKHSACESWAEAGECKKVPELVPVVLGLVLVNL